MSKSIVDAIKIGDRIIVTMSNNSNSVYEGVVTCFGKDGGSFAPDCAVWSDDWSLNKGGGRLRKTYLRSEDMTKVVWVKPPTKIKVGSTYLTPTGTKLTILFANDDGVLADNHKWYLANYFSKWTEVPPEEWVKLYRRSDGYVCVLDKTFPSLIEAYNYGTSHPNTKWIQNVRVDENYNTSSV